MLVRLVAALLHSAPPEAASLRGASSKKLFIAIVRGGTAMLQHTDGVHTVLHFLLYSFTKQIQGSSREIGIFGEGLYIRVQFLQNFRPRKLAEVCTGVTQEQ